MEYWKLHESSSMPVRERERVGESKCMDNIFHLYAIWLLLFKFYTVEEELSRAVWRQIQCPHSVFFLPTASSICVAERAIAMKKSKNPQIDPNLPFTSTLTRPPPFHAPPNSLTKGFFLLSFHIFRFVVYRSFLTLTLYDCNQYLTICSF